MTFLLKASGLGATALFTFLILRIIYRLTFHPLARFPGPRLAAATSLYQAWFDLRKSTSYVKQFPDLHRKYGPIVRVNPGLLQIFDMSAYNEIFKGGSRFTKHPDIYNQEGTNGLFNVLDPKIAKPWRDPYQPYFSKSAIVRLEPLICDRLHLFLSILDSAASANTPVDLTMGYRSLTSDVVTSYMFADKGFESLNAKEFRSPILTVMEDFFQFNQWTMYLPYFFGWLTRQLQLFPQDWVMALVPAMGAINWISEACGVKVKKIMDAGGSGSSYPTIFDAWANPDLSEKRAFVPSLRQLISDASTFHGAGTDTTATALMMGTWHLINDRKCLDKVREEVKRAATGSKDGKLMNSSVLENLPYLRAVIKETLRLNVGVPGKIPRVVSEGGTVLCGQYIPAGTGVFSAAYCYHYDPKFFPEPEKFNPDRWFQPNAQELESRLVTFSRGPRSCLGINLAYAELYLTLANVIARFDMTLFETTKEDMEWKDNFVITTKGHLKVLLKHVPEAT